MVELLAMVPERGCESELADQLAVCLQHKQLPEIAALWTRFAPDPARLSLLLNELRLPAIKLLWSKFAGQADKEGWPAARFLAAIAEHELAERDRRRIERHLAEARLLPGKTLDTFAFEAVPMISRAQITAVATGDA
jgi:hypothetical protein